MKLIDAPEFCRACKTALKERSRFGVWLSPGFMGIRKGLLCRDVFDPLIPSIEKILIFDLDENHRRLGKLRGHIERSAGYHILDLAGERWDYFLPLLFKPKLLSNINSLRGSILIQCLPDNIPWRDVFKYCYGPVINGSLDSVDNAAQAYAEQHLGDQRVFVIIDPINSGMESITITARHDLIDPVFNIAASTCDITRHMLGVF